MSDPASVTPREGTARPARWGLWAIVAVALAVRLVPWFAGHDHADRILQNDDCYEYHRCALNMLQWRTVSIDRAAPPAPDDFRPPAYPALLALVYAVAGARPDVAVLAQILLAAIVVVWLAKLSEALLPGAGPPWAALLLAIDLPAAANALALMSETFAILLTLAATRVVVALWAPEPERDMRRIAAGATLAGLLVGFAVLTRPALLYFPLVLWAWFLPLTGWRRIALAYTVFLVAGAIPVQAWLSRNERVLGVREFSSTEGFDLIYFRAAPAMARVWGVSLPEARRRLGEEAAAEMRRLGAPREQTSKIWSRVGRRHLREHPRAYMIPLATGVAKAWLGLANQHYLQLFGYDYQGPGLFPNSFSGESGGMAARLAAMPRVALVTTLVEAALRLWVLVLGAWGMVLAVRDPGGRRLLALVLPALVYFSITAGRVLSYYRFRLPLDPYWFLLADLALRRKLPAFPGQAAAGVR